MTDDPETTPSSLVPGPCIACGYDLRATRTDTVCPECGTDVRRSLPTIDVRTEDVRHLETLRIGARTMQTAIITLVSAAGLGLLGWLIDGPATITLGCFVALIGVLMMAFAALLLADPDDDAQPHAPLRLIVSFGALALLLSPLLWGAAIVAAVILKWMASAAGAALFLAVPILAATLLCTVLVAGHRLIRAIGTDIKSTDIIGAADLSARATRRVIVIGWAAAVAGVVAIAPPHTVILQQVAALTGIVAGLLALHAAWRLFVLMQTLRSGIKVLIDAAPTGTHTEPAGTLPP
ncbi:MAG: hypothetical protein AAGF47_04725 [Planctomycetota bacterium]